MNTEGIKAETLLSLYDIKENLNVIMEGVFSRNYSEDIIHIEHDNDSVNLALSRNGLFHLLPEGLFFDEKMLQNVEKRGFDFKSKYTEFKKQKKEIELFFQPFDTAYFNLNLDLEHKLNHVTEMGNDFFMEFLDNSENETSNEYIAALQKMLPFASQMKGNVALLVDILKNVLSVEKIKVRETAYFSSRFIIYKDGLTKAEYHAMDYDLKQLFVFLRHWFLPVEREYDYRIKSNPQPFILKESLILDYNTYL